MAWGRTGSDEGANESLPSQRTGLVEQGKTRRPRDLLRIFPKTKTLKISKSCCRPDLDCLPRL